MLRVAIAGAGALGRRWTEVVEQPGNAVVAAFVDPLIGTPQAPQWVDEHSGCPQLTAVQALDGDIDVVIVTAQSPAHAEAVRAALESGFHVLVEKPFTTSLDDAAALVTLAKAQGKTLMVSQNYRFFPGPQKIREIALTGQMGRICSVIGQFWRDWPGKPYQHAMEHPMALEMAIHHFDLVRAMFDANVEDGRLMEWNPAGTSYRHGGGAVEALFSMKNAGGYFPFLYSGSLVSKGRSTPWGGLWRFEFERDTLIADEVNGSYVLIQAREQNPCVLSEFGDQSMAFSKSFAHFHDCVTAGKEPWCSGRDNQETLRMALAFFR